MSWQVYWAQIDSQRSQAKELWLKTFRPWHERKSGWQFFMSWALRESPQRALIPLDIAIHFPEIRPRQQSLDDCLAAVAHRLLGNFEPPQVKDVDAIYQLTRDYAEVVSKLEKPFPLRQNTIFMVLEYCTAEQRRSFFRTLLTCNMPLTSHTLLQFAKKFFDEGEVLIGLEILRSAVNIGADLSSMPIQSSCVKLLRTRKEGEDWAELQSDMLIQILEMGIKPDLILWTCIMLNEIETGNFVAAWRWYDKGIRDGLGPNRVTFSVLLKTAKKGLADSFLDRVIEEATNKKVLPHDLDMIFDILHAICLVERSKLVDGTSQPFDAMLRFYSQYCDIRPLQELGICPEQYPIPGGLGHEVCMPSPRLIGMMLLGYLSQHGQKFTIASLYLRYHNLVEADHPVIAPTASTDHISNAFLKALGCRSDQLDHCTLVVKNMLNSNPHLSYVTQMLGNTNPGQTGKPTVQTWNILLRNYMMHGQLQAAEKILSMMRARGIRPDSVTWNHIIAGYVGRQDVENVVGASRQMKTAGYEYDDFTIQALRHLVDKTRYIQAMESESLHNAGYSLASGPEKEVTEIEDSRGSGLGHRSMPFPLSSPNEPTARTSPTVSDSVSSGRSKADISWLDNEMREDATSMDIEVRTNRRRDAFITDEG